MSTKADIKMFVSVHAATALMMDGIGTKQAVLDILTADDNMERILNTDSKLFYMYAEGMRGGMSAVLVPIIKEAIADVYGSIME